MKKLFASTTMAAILVLVSVAAASAAVNAVTPSTNDINRTNGWAHVDQLSQGLGTTDLQFISTRSFYSCFEYRTDGDTTQQTSPTNWNPAVTDGLYPYHCQNNSSSTYTITAYDYVEVRMVFGAETDERFDWTRFEVIPLPVAVEKAQCEDDGWEGVFRSDRSTFKNRGDCVQYVEAGK